MAATTKGGVVAYDPRTGAKVWRVEVAGNQGSLEKLAVDPGGAAAWVLGGTARGCLLLWDVRF